MMRSQSEGFSEKEFKEQFMEKAKQSVKWGDFIAATTAFFAKQDVIISYGTAKNATEHNCQLAMAVAVAECCEVWKAVAAIAATGGLVALLDSIQVKEHEDGSYGFKGSKYATLQEVLQKVIEIPLLYSIVAVSTIANIMDIDLDANKPISLTTPIYEPKPLILITPIQDQEKVIIEGFDRHEQQNDSLKEGFETYDGPNANVLGQKIHVLYGKPGQNGVPDYIGRTSGKVDSLNEKEIKPIIKNRDRNHHMNEKGFGKAKQIEVSTEYDVIRGLEQLYIDKLGGAQSMGGTSSNAINSISKTNPKREQYLDAVNKDSKD